ncbi:hypothetical protein V1264_002617 [Littorina saxatilis]|uniref:Uncharacterized protein n=1 Tax=Littorina saxatilis TaxID=31220 RepID=A0AAN9G8B3_9CAEN
MVHRINKFPVHIIYDKCELHEHDRSLFQKKRGVSYDSNASYRLDKLLRVAGSWVGLIVGLVVGALLLFAAVLIVLNRRRRAERRDFEPELKARRQSLADLTHLAVVVGPEPTVQSESSSSFYPDAALESTSESLVDDLSEFNTSEADDTSVLEDSTVDEL